MEVKVMSSSPICDRRKAMYKVSTPPWKETFKKRCFARLRQSRDDTINRHRSGTKSTSLVQSVMTEEWRKLRTEHSLPGESQILFGREDEEVEYFQSVLGEIQDRLKEEEQRMIEMYCNDYEKDICEAAGKLDVEDRVTCPICQKSDLLMNSSVIFCKCGLRIDTEQDALTLGHLKESLEMCTGLHNSECDQTAIFTQQNVAGVDTLIMSCQICEFTSVVL